MSQTIDSKVVEMKFDNDNFEKNVAASMKTLDDLEKRIENLEKSNASLDGLKHAFDGFDLSKVGAALDTVTSRFSRLGVVGATVLQDLTHDAYNMVKTFGSSVWNKTFGQIKSGGKSRSLNIAEAQFRIEGLGLKYEDYYDSINKAVDGTAYGFDEAAVAASKFASSGVAAGKDMDDALRSISGMAAMTGRSYSDLAGVMGDAAALGKVSNDTFTRLAERGLAALNEYAKRTNQTVEDVREAAKQGEISFIEFARVMNEAYGEHATKADETFTGVTANIKAQLSKIGQGFYEPLISNNSDLVLMLQSVKKQLRALKEFTDPLAKAMSGYILKLSRWGKGIVDSIDVSKTKPFFDNLVKVFNNLTMAFENVFSNVIKPFGKAVKEALYEVFPSLNTGQGLLVALSDKVVELSKRFRDFTADIGLFGDKGVALKEVLKTIFELLKSFASIVKSLLISLKPLLKLVGTIGHALVSALAGFGPAISSALSNLPGLIEVGANIVAGLVTGILAGITSIGSVIIQVAKYILEGFLNFFIIRSPSRLMAVMVGIPIVAGIAAGIILGKDRLIAAMDSVGETLRAGMSKAIDLMFIPFQVIHEKFRGPVASLKQFFEDLGNTILFKPIKIGLKIVADAFELLEVVLSRMIVSVKALDQAGFNKLLQDLRGFIVTIITMLTLNKLSKAVTSFSGGMSKIAEAIKGTFNSFKKAVQSYARAKVLARLGDIFKNLAIAVLAITGSILVLGWALSDPSRYQSIMTSLTIISAIVVTLVGIATLFGALATKYEGFEAKSLSGVALTFVGIAGSIWLVASAIKKIGKLQIDQIIAGFVGIIVMFIAVAIAMHKFKSANSGLTKHDWLLVISFGASVSLMASAIKKISLLALFSPTALKSATAAIASIVGIFGAIAIGMEALSKLKYGEVGNMGMLKEMPLTFLAIGAAVGLIASAIKKLSKIPQVDLDKAYDKIFNIMLFISLITLAAHFASNAIGNLLFSVAALVTACGIIIGYFGTIKNSAVIDRGIEVLKKIGANILKFIFVLEVITNVVGGGTSDLKTLLYVSSLVAACGAIIFVVDKVKPESVKLAVNTLLQLGAGILAFVWILNKITKQSTQLTRGDLFNLHKPGKKGVIDKITQFAEISLMITTISKAIARVAITVGIVSKLVTDVPQLIEAMGLIGYAMVAIFGTLLILDNMDTGNGENIKGAAKVINAISVAIIAISGSLLVLSNLPFEGLAAGAAGIAIILGIMAIILAQAKEVKNSREFNAKAIGALVAGIVGIGVTLVALTSLNQDENGWSRILAACIGIGFCLAALGKAIQLASGFELSKDTAKAILMASGSLVVIGFAIGIIAQFEWDKYKTGLLAAVGCVAAIVILLKMMDKLDLDWKSALAFDLACASLVVVAASVAIIGDKDWNKYAGGLIGMGACVIAIGLALKLAQDVKWQAALGLVAGAGVMLAAAYSISMLKDFEWYEILAAAAAMAMVIGVMGGILVGLTAIATGTEGIGAGVILAIAASLVAMAFSLYIIAAAMDVAVTAFQNFITIFTPETANQILAFFDVIGAGLKPAAQAIVNGLKAAIDAITEEVPNVEASLDALVRAVGDSLTNLVGVVEEKAVEINNAINHLFDALKQSAGEAGTDFVGGFLTSLSRTDFKHGIWVAAAALGLYAVNALRSPDGIDAHSDSVKTTNAGIDFVGGFVHTLENSSDAASKPAAQIGANAIGGLLGGISEAMKSVNLDDLWGGIKSAFSKITPQDVAKGMSNPISFIKEQFEVVKDVVGGTFGGALKEGIQNGGLEAITQSVGGSGFSGIGEALTQLISGTGNFQSVLGGFDWSKLTGLEGIGGLKDYLSGMGVTMDNLSGDNIPKLIEKLKEAGFAGNDLIEALKQLGITEDQLRSLGLADALGIDEAKDGVNEVKDVVESIIKGDFGNAPERWDRLFEYFVKNGKTAQEAYAAIADAQNAVNEKLGSNVRHTAAEMEKAVSDSVKKANEAVAKANEGKKEPRDFKKDPYNAKPQSTEDKLRSEQEANKQMMNNMPYENYKAIKAKEITSEAEKQTAEAYKQKLANEHIYTLREKEAALAGVKSTSEKLAAAGLTDEARKQLTAENERYQKVVDTYNEQQKMIKAIEEQENATKKADEAEKKRGETVKANNSAVVYGSDEYWNQYKNNPNSSKAAKVSKPVTKVETKLESEPVVEVTPKLDVKAPDVTEVKNKVVNQVETEIKDLQAKVEITPKVNTAQAEQQISNFKQKLEPLKTDIPKTFEGIGDAVSKHLSTIASKITQEGGKIATNTKTVFQNAVSQAISVLNGSDTINKFYNAGKSAAQGYANGIRDKGALNAVRSAGATLGNTASKALKTAIKSNSPSKLFMEIGGYTAEGYAYGILGNLSMVSNASEQMADASVNQLYSAVGAIQQAVNDGIDLSPTVVPVIDATQIQNGLNNMRSTMNYGREDLASISANIDAKASYDNSQVEEMRNRMDSMTTAFNDLATIMSNQPAPEVTANVNLMGDADGVFKLVQQSNSRYTKMHGKSAFA